MQVFSGIKREVIAMALVFDVKVMPSSGSFGFFKDKNGELKCRLKSVPEKGRANQVLVKGLAKLLGVAQADVEIIAGETSRKKKVKIHVPLTLDQLYAALQLSVQTGIFPNS